MKAGDFKVGQIYKMSPTHRSKVKKSYYIEIIDVGLDYIITNIPLRSSLKICHENGNWIYQTERMSYIGDKESFGHLLYNQRLN